VSRAPSFFNLMKKRILFVEDDPLLVEVYVMMLSDSRDLWEVTTARDGPQALQLMEQTAFDVVVSDMKMPRMSGIELLREVKQRCPLSSRIILSGMSDQEEIARCLGATHQFLAKPFNVGDLKATLARVGGLDAYLNDKKLQALVGQLGSLPSFPSLYVEIMKELDSSTSSLESIAAIIAKDPGMTAKILQIVNSAAVGFSRQVSSPYDAVQLLGVGTVRSLVLSAHIFSCFDRTLSKGFSITRLWDHAMKTGAFARRIMQLEQVEPAAAEDAYTAGMLHDVGKLMLANSVPGQFQQALTLAAERKIPFPEAEFEVFGATHAGAAAYLLGLWGLPAPIVEAVAFHHEPRKSGMRALGPLAAVHVANVLEQELSKAEPCGRPSEIDAQYLAEIGLPNRLATWRAETAKLVVSEDA
jgi:HD-like signal output (HDOD) protein/ActR/RegA family two-component response regulator